MRDVKTRKQVGIGLIVCSAIAYAVFGGTTWRSPGTPEAAGLGGQRQQRVEARCPNAAPPPRIARVLQKRLEEVRKAFPTQRSPGSVTVDVYFHILHSTDSSRTGDVPDQVIREQIRILNNAFAGNAGYGAPTPFRFRLRDIDRTPNDAWFNMVYREDPTTEEREAKTEKNKGDVSTLNIYTVRLRQPPPYGWARFPLELPKKVDGIVVGYKTLPGGGLYNYDEGDTAVHEVGHWLGLYHTYENGCNSPGDYINDTNAETGPKEGCPYSENSCPAPGYDPIDNFMNSTWDSCMKKFTNDQSAVMDANYRAYRTPRHRFTRGSEM